MVPALLGSDNPSVIHLLMCRQPWERSTHGLRGFQECDAESHQKLSKKYTPDIRVNALCPALLEFRDEDDAAYRERTVAKAR